MFLKSLFANFIFLAQISSAEIVSGNTSGCETLINCTVSSAQTSTTKSLTGETNVNTQGSGATSTQSTYSSFGEAGSGAYSKAREAQNKANSTASAAADAAIGFWGICATRRGDWACPVAAVLTKASQNASNKAGEAGTFMRSIGADGSTQGSAGGGSAPPVDRELQSKINKLKADLANRGYNTDVSGNVTLPNGSTVDGDLNQQSLLASGMSQAEADQIAQGLAQAKQKLQDQLGKEGADSNGLLAKSNSSGFGRVSIASLDGSEKETAKATEAERTGIDRDPAAWEGFYKKFGNSVIGVSHSDIFLMVEKRVEKERQGMGN
jgi:hypothetical protein